jgi:antitoxin ParD1/3/4
MTSMSTMNVSLPESMKAFVDEQVGARGYGSSSEYIRDLIRRDQDRTYLRSMIVAGAKSEPGPQADRSYFDGLRRRARRAASRR